MASISTGLKKRGSRYLYEGNYAGAVECFFRVYFMEPEDTENIIELIYTLNQNGDYIQALTFAYALLGKLETYEKLDTLYFLTAEAFGGVGCPEGCAQMLERCLQFNPNGANCKEAQAFLKDIKEKYSVEKYDKNTNCVAMQMANSFINMPFPDYETAVCVHDVAEMISAGEQENAVNRIEQEFERGNFSVTLLTMAIMLGTDMNNKKYVKRNAERFRFVDDYTVSELRVLAGNMTDIENDDVAYTVYRELYAKESGEKHIAFGFAVACERIGDISHAKDIAKNILSASGGSGPCKYYIENIGDCTHSYMYKYENDAEDKIFQCVENGTTSLNDIFEMLDYLPYATLSEGIKIINSINELNELTRFELRRVAINPDINLIIRVHAAKKINDEKRVYLNTGGDIIEYSPEIEKAINDFFERGLKDERIN